MGEGGSFLTRKPHPPLVAAGEIKDEGKRTDIIRAAKLDAWRTSNCPLDKDTLGRGTWGLVSESNLDWAAAGFGFACGLTHWFSAIASHT